MFEEIIVGKCTLRSGLRNAVQSAILRIGGFALLRVPTIDHEFFLVHFTILFIWLECMPARYLNDLAGKHPRLLT